LAIVGEICGFISGFGHTGFDEHEIEKNMNQNKTILVTGAAGFLGGRVVEGLVQAGYTVRATARNNAQKGLLTGLGATFMAADLRDAAAVQNIVEGCDMVVHCAAKSSPWGPYQDFYEANVVATDNLLNASQQFGIQRFVHISTPSIYFEFRHRRDIKESDLLPHPMVNHYASTKYLSEQRVFESGIPAIALRPRALIGRGDTVIMPRVLRAYHEGRLRQVGDGNNIVSITPVANVVEAIRLCLIATESALGKSYNLSSGEAVPLWPLLGQMLKRLNLLGKMKPLPFGVAMFAARLMGLTAKITGKEPALTPYSVGILAYDMTLDISQAQTHLNYQPTQSVADALEEFAQWWEQTQTAK
jgi:2-alkyl-3-oxoalkanoate reductase